MQDTYGQTIKKIIYLLLILLFFRDLIFSAGSLYAEENSSGTYFLQGMVFYDYNKNGIKDADDFGLGGIYVLYSGKSVRTATDGTYKFVSNCPIDYITSL